MELALSPHATTGSIVGDCHRSHHQTSDSGVDGQTVEYIMNKCSMQSF